MLETGLCNNKRTIGLQWVESQIIQGIEAHLASPDLMPSMSENIIVNGRNFATAPIGGAPN